MLRGLILWVCDAGVFGEPHIWGLNPAPSALYGLRQQQLSRGWEGLSLAWEGGAATSGLERRGVRGGGVKHSGEANARSSASNLL